MQAATYIWAKIIGILEDRLSAVAVSAMFDDAEIVELNDRALVLYSPSDFRQEIIRRTYKSHIEDILRDEFNLPVSLEVWGDVEIKKNKQDTITTSMWTYNPHFNFYTFIAGSSNQVPLRAAMHVAENLSDSIYNPLYLYGPPGVGKTHLVYSIANRVSQLYPDAKIVCIKGDQFTNELIQCILSHSTADFKNKYRGADILLVDDIQFIAGKESTQEEFFHTFNYLYELRKKIVLTSDRAPSDMPTLEDRLRSRFGAGVMVKIEPPDKNTRALIIEAKAKELGLGFGDEVIDYLAEKLCDNCRQIEGGLRKIKAYKDLSNMRLTMENIARTIEDIQTSETSAVVTPELVLRYTCRYYGVEENQLKGRQRSKNISEPRQVAMYLIRTMTSHSLDEIGKMFHRDHSTVNYALTSIHDALSSADSSMKNKLQDIICNIESNI